MIRPTKESRFHHERLENLRCWIDSGQANEWVSDHDGTWEHADWLSLLDELRGSVYWPMSADDIGRHLDSVGNRYREHRDRILGNPDVSPTRKALAWYVIGLGLIGFAAGFFAGASHTPIIGTLLPLLFAVIGGTGGIYISGADLEQSSTLKRLKWLGCALVCFGTTCLLGSAVGISLRLHYEHPHTDELVTLWHSKTQTAIELAALRGKLNLLGLSAEERKRVMVSAAKSLDDATTPITAGQIRQVASESDKLLRELRSLRDRALASHENIPEDAGDLIKQLDFFGHQAAPWTKSGMPRDLYKWNVELVYYHLSRIAMPAKPETAAFIQRTGFDTQNLYNLFIALDSEFSHRDDLDWKMGGSTSDRLDKFFQTVGSATKLTPDSEQVAAAVDDSKPETSKAKESTKKR